MMLDITKSSYMTLDYEFFGIRYIKDKLCPTKWKLSLNLAGTISEGDDIPTAKKKLLVSYQRMLYFLEVYIEDPVFINAYDEKSVELFGDITENTVVYCPGEPSDDMIAELLHCKLTALSKGDMAFGHIVLKAADCPASTSFISIDGKYSLPNQEDFMGEESVYDLPWWNRYDCDTYDFVVFDGYTKEGLVKEFGTQCILDEFDKSKFEELGIEAEIKGAVISPWKPKLV